MEELLDSRAADCKRMGIDNGRNNISAFNNFVLEANQKLKQTNAK
jgi:hypothetical protein